MAVATQTVSADLIAAGLSIEIIPTGEPQSGKLRRVNRLRRLLTSIYLIAKSRAPSAYIAVNGNAGIFWNILQVISARATQKSITLHHHSFRYIARWDPLMAVLVRAAGSAAWHFTNCDAMNILFSEKYPYAQHVKAYSNIGSVAARPEEPLGNNATPLRLGHLSNLTEEKGVGRAIDAFRQALQSGYDVELAVAGPAMSAYAERIISSAKDEFGTKFQYLGPVYEHQKQNFFSSLDIFLFPSLYPTETQGIVNLEAIAHGVPVVAFDQCCIKSDIHGKGGLVIGRKDNFSEALVEYISKFIQRRSEFRRSARERFADLMREHEIERNTLRTRLRGCRYEEVANA